MKFKSNIFILPGLGNSSPDHWQSIWQDQYPNFKRINQQHWLTPVCDDWINCIDARLANEDLSETILVAHSLACITIAFWAKKFNKKIKGALLVAPCDTKAKSYPVGTTGFTPKALKILPFPTIVVTSSNDYYVSLERATSFAKSWGSQLKNIGAAGHINVASGYGNWIEGLSLLKELDQSE